MTEPIESPDNFQVELRTEGPTSVLLLRGELDMESATILKDQFSRLGRP